jgi:hypothetical protein
MRFVLLIVDGNREERIRSDISDTCSKVILTAKNSIRVTSHSLRVNISINNQCQLNAELCQYSYLKHLDRPF